jgi:L,D-transpeptidase ErfK/SrfK
MKNLPALRALVLLASAAVLLCGCSLFGEGPKWGKRDAQKIPTEVRPELPEPVATQRFEIDPSVDVVGVVQKTRATKDDTLTDIARRFNVGYEEIVRANPGVDPWLPGEGREIVIPSQFILPNAPREGIVINVPAMRLFYYPKVKKGEKQVVHTYPIGVGRVGWATPEGTTKIVRGQKDPTWRPTPSILKEHLEEKGEKLDKVIGPGPDNPLGRYAFYLGLRSSHGCIRLYPEDIEQLFKMAPIGTQVRVVNQPFVFGWHQGSLHIQAYDVLEDDTRDWKKAQVKLLKKDLAERIQKELASRNEKIDWEAVTQLTRDPRGVPVSISGGPDSLVQIVANATLVQNKVASGATWDGVSDLPVDEATFKELMSDREPAVEASATPAPPPAPKPLAN